MSTPIFILGNPRSGSSLITACLKQVLHIQGYNEGHFLKYMPKYQTLTDTIFSNRSLHEIHKDVGFGNINKEIFMHNIYLAFKNSYESLFDQSQTYWLDKTPIVFINLVHIINQLWPNAKFIVLKRRSLENIQSRIKKFTNTSFEQHCIEWHNTMNTWFYLDKNFITNRFIEIEHYDILFNSDNVGYQIASFLPEYKEYAKQITEYIQTHHPQSTTGFKPIILDINTIDWSKEQKITHDKICSETLSLYKYSTDSNYFIT